MVKLRQDFLPESVEPRRAAGYVRVSQVGGREGDSFLSPEVQREKIEAWASFKGWTVTRWYVDLDVSGTGKVRRPEFERMMEDARTGAFDAIAVYRLTRFARSVAGAASAYTELERLGVGLVSVTEDIDTTTVAGNFMRNILFALAEFESQRIGEEWRNVHANRRRRGLANVTRPTYGFVLDRGRIVGVDDAEAAAVRLMYRLRLQRTGYVSIRNELQRQCFLSKQGNPRFSIGAIRKILRNPLYAGLVVTREGELLDGQHKGIVSRDVWEEVQRTHRHADSYSNHRLALLSGLMVCSSCGYRMGYESKDGNGARAYLCNTNNKNSRPCDHSVSIRADYADDEVESLFRRRFDPKRMPHGGKVKAGRQQAEWERKATRLKARGDELTRALDALADQRYMKGTLAVDEYDRQFTRYSQERADALAAAEELERMAASVRPLDRSIFDLWESAPMHVKQQQLRKAIASIEVKPAPRRGPGQRALVKDRLVVSWLQ